MIKENFIPLADALREVSNKTKLLAKQSARNEQDLDIAGVPATAAQEAALIAELDTAASLAAWNEAVRLFSSAVDENPWTPV